MKIFEFNGKRNGSYIDPISGAVGVNSNGVWAQTEKGMAWRGDGSSSKVIYDGQTLSGDFSAISWYKSNYQGGNDNQTIASNTTSFQPFRVRNGFWNYYFTDGIIPTSQALGSPQLNDGEWKCLVITCDKNGDIVLYLNNVELFSEAFLSTGDIVIDSLNIGFGVTADYLDGYVGYAAIYDHILTSEERAKLLNEFNNAHPITKTVQ